VQAQEGEARTDICLGTDGVLEAESWHYVETLARRAAQRELMSSRLPQQIENAMLLLLWHLVYLIELLCIASIQPRHSTPPSPTLRTLTGIVIVRPWPLGAIGKGVPVLGPR
jgi:hypothetical protein